MAERFEIISKYNRRFFLPGCPVIFEKGAITKDNTEEKLLLQLKLVNIGRKNIKGVYITIKCLEVGDVASENLESHVYLDLNISSGTAFGEKTPIYLSNPLTRSFLIRIDKIVYQDDEVWKNETDEYLQMVPLQSEVKVDQVLFEQYCREIKKNGNNRVPVEANDYWLCSCGAINHADVNICYQCRIAKDKIFLINDMEYLKTQFTAFCQREIEREREAKRQAEEQEQLRQENIKKQELLRAERLKRQQALIQKHGKKVIIGAIAVLCTVLLVFIGVNVVSTIQEKQLVRQKYERGLDLIKQHRYDEAETMLIQVLSYKDAQEVFNSLEGLEQEYANQTKYDRAKALVEEKEYVRALELFKELGDYEDCNNLYETTKSTYKAKLIELIRISIKEKKYEDAQNSIADLKGLGFEEEAKEQMELSLASEYKYADELMKKKDYSTAINVFDNIIDYNDSKQKRNQCFRIIQKKYIKQKPIVGGLNRTIVLFQDGTVSLDMSSPSDSDKIVNKVMKKYSGLKSIYWDWIGNELVVIKEDGKCDYYYTIGEKVYENYRNWTNLTQVAVGKYGMAALRKDGTVVEDTTSSDYRGAFNAATEWTDIVYITVGDGNLLVGVKNDGTVVYTGRDGFLNAASGTESWTDIVKVFISTDDKTVVGLKMDGSLVTSGIEVMNATEQENVVDIAFRKNIIYFLHADGTVTGSDSKSDISTWEDIVYISITGGFGENTLFGIKSDGTIVSENEKMWNWNNKKAKVK